MADELLPALGRYQRQQQDSVAVNAIEEEALRPLNEAERAAVLDAAFGRLEQEPHEDATPRDEAELVPPISMAERRHGSKTALVIGVVLAIAAALVLWRGAATTPTPPEAPLVAALPSYAITQLRAGEAKHRAAPEGVVLEVSSTPHAHFTLVLTPARPVLEPVAVALVARTSGGETRVTRPVEGVQVSANGALQLDGPLDEFIALTPGVWTLELLVGPPETLPEDAEALRRSPTEPPWRTLKMQVTIVADD